MNPWNRRVSAKAVLIGGMVDILATNILMIPVAAVVFAGLRDSHLSPAQQTAAFTTALTSDPIFYLVGLVLGSLASILGGWTAARFVSHSHRLQGALSAFACVALGLYGVATGHDALPLWQHLAFIVLSPALGALGGGIQASQQSRRPPRETGALEAVQRHPAADLSYLGRLVYGVNRGLLVVASLLAFVFCLGGIYAAWHHQSTALLGTAVLLGICLGAATLARAGARHLRAAHRRHWLYNLASLALLLAPVALIAIPLLAPHTK